MSLLVLADAAAKAGRIVGHLVWLVLAVALFVVAWRRERRGIRATGLYVGATVALVLFLITLAD